MCNTLELNPGYCGPKRINGLFYFLYSQRNIIFKDFCLCVFFFFAIAWKPNEHFRDVYLSVVEMCALNFTLLHNVCTSRFKVHMKTARRMLLASA